MEELHSQEMQKRKEMQLRSLTIYLIASSGLARHGFNLVIFDTMMPFLVLESKVLDSVFYLFKDSSVCF